MVHIPSEKMDKHGELSPSSHALPTYSSTDKEHGELRIKNTFYDVPEAALKEPRRIVSAPTGQAAQYDSAGNDQRTEGMRHSRLGASHLSLSDDDAIESEAEAQRDADLYPDDDDSFTAWPATPEGNFMPQLRAFDRSTMGASSSQQSEDQQSMPTRETPQRSGISSLQTGFGEVPHSSSLASWQSGVSSWQSGGSDETSHHSAPELQQQPQQPACGGTREVPLLATVPPPLQRLRPPSPPSSTGGASPPIPPAMCGLPSGMVLPPTAGAPMQHPLHMQRNTPPESPVTSPGATSWSARQAAASSASGAQQSPSGASRGQASAANADISPGGGQKTAAIAQLQETLQAPPYTSRFKCPSGVKVLQWSYRQRVETRLMFRAVVAFLRNGVPHHVAGDWHTCKKHARQSAAEVALGLVSGASHEEQFGYEQALVDTSRMLPAPRNEAARTAATADHVRILNDVVREKAAAREGKDGAAAEETLEWEYDEGDAGQWFAMVHFNLAGIPHAFYGPAFGRQEQAQAELARRVLWYLGYTRCRGYYIPNKSAILASGCQVPPAPSRWAGTLGFHVED